MKLICSSFDEFENHIKSSNRRIILFGAGAIGQVIVPEILKNHNLLKYVDCYIDNDKSKWGQAITVAGSDFAIRSPEYLNECPKDMVILVNVSRFNSVLSQLESMECTKTMTCFIIPMMLIHNYCSSVSGGRALMAEEPLIPKKLHYMWLGGGRVPDKLKRCMDSWREYCPGYEIIEWNESNYDIGKHSYMKKAYEAGAYGFVPDYARLDILYNEGGFYLDTDVELLGGIDDLRYQEAFCGVEKWQVINFGGLSGAVQGHPMIKRFLDAREGLRFIDDYGVQNRNTCGFYDTGVAIDAGYRIDGTTQNVNGMNVYAYDWFHPYDYMSGIVNQTDNTHSIHWFNGGWLDDEMKEANRKTAERYKEIYNVALKSPYGYCLGNM